MDKISQARRSWNLSRIRSQDTKPEMVVRSFLHRNGLRFRIHVKTLPGHPDIVLPKYKTVIEVRGIDISRVTEFAMPSTDQDSWEKKLQKNVERDKRERAELEKQGWKVIVIWEYELKEATTKLSSILKEIKISE